MKIVTMKRLNSALYDVRRELDHLGIWTPAVADVDIYLVPAGVALGWKWNGAEGEIHIPAISITRLAHRLLGIGSLHGLRDVLRHELGHGYADVHRAQLNHNRAFAKVFGGGYDDRSIPYTERPCELFADCFAAYVRRAGRDTIKDGVWLENRSHWRFVHQFVCRVRRTVWN